VERRDEGGGPLDGKGNGEIFAALALLCIKTSEDHLLAPSRKPFGSRLHPESAV
jgi:hypothetical protein